MAQQPGLKLLTLFAATATSLGSSVTLTAGPFSNPITIRRFRFGSGTPTGTTPTLLLDVNDGGTNGAGTTAVADRAAAAVVVPGFTTEANDTGAADGYLLAAGNVLTATLTTAGTSPVFPGATLVMEYVDGVG